jgi:hypothetical protein
MIRSIVDGLLLSLEIPSLREHLSPVKKKHANGGSVKNMDYNPYIT